MPHKEQLTTEIFTSDILYVVGTIAIVIAIVGIGFLDAGLTRRRNLLDNWLGKLLAGVSTAFGFLFIGYGVWWWQYYTALGIPKPLKHAISDWWLGGTALTTLPQNLDPKLFPAADVSLVFMALFIAFAMLLGAFIHSAGLDRIRPAALYGICFVVGAIVFPFVSYLTWGSTSPLTNHGLHDYVGVFALYIFVGAFSLVLNWQLGPRRSQPRPEDGGIHNVGNVGTGVFLVMFALPAIVLASGWLFPGQGYFGISMTSTAIGTVIISVFAAFLGGGLMGMLLTARTKDPVYGLLGPLAGYISCGTLFDVVDPWVVLLVSLAGPLCFLGMRRAVRAVGIEDAKIGPLMLGPGIFAALIAGIVAGNVHTGGYVGLTGKYGFQHAHITFGWQLIGVGVTLGIAVLTAVVLTTIAKVTVGLRVTNSAEETGLDGAYWSPSLPVAVTPATSEASTTAGMAGVR
jgi:Amt family ammonium transporter